MSLTGVVRSLAYFKEAGKNIACDFDLAVLDPKCMVSPNLEKCLFSMLMALHSSFLF
jgi:hypothetical protein